ncbi:hypothetical protein Ahy_B09g098801 isoform A [Arachis hypogaea]|uniref:Transposase MuDR plant domain-containing protein n=1 Tax=Arachis hypogaea TaxID=3818 RepID=A0A444XSY5_ARAHY|nr:hypothetical protein Ahy_B09g098801 isoform A [Arachis hypogaea]
MNQRGYDAALPDEAATEKLSNQTQATTTKNEAPNLGDNHQTHVEDQEGQRNPEEADGRGRKRRKKHARPQPSGRAQPAQQNNCDAHADEDACCGVQGRRNHRRPRPSGQRILPPREENQAPRVVVPNPHDHDEKPIEYQYHSKELHTPPGSDSEDEKSVFPQHNPDTKFGKIRLVLGMEFGMMRQFKDAVRKEAFFLKVEPHRCSVICYNENCPWEVYCARRNQPPSYQIKTLVDEHTCPRSNKSRSVTCKWVSKELISKIRAYNRTYQFHINTVPSQEFWADAEGLPCLPPPYKRPIERPTKKRARHESESHSGSQYKLKRSYGKTSCKYCKKVGHNSRTCLDKNHVAHGEDADAQEAPQGGQPVTGGVVPPRGLQDMSDSEQEMY